MSTGPKRVVMYLLGEQQNSLAEAISHPTSKHFVWPELDHLPTSKPLAGKAGRMACLT